MQNQTYLNEAWRLIHLQRSPYIHRLPYLHNAVLKLGCISGAGLLECVTAGCEVETESVLPTIAGLAIFVPLLAILILSETRSFPVQSVTRLDKPISIKIWLKLR